MTRLSTLTAIFITLLASVLQAAPDEEQNTPNSVPDLVRTMDGDNRTAGKQACNKLFDAVQENLGTPEQAKFAVALAKQIDQVKSPDTLRELFRLLSFAGGDQQSVDLVANALADESKRAMALWSLIRMPGQPATQVLASQLDTKDATWQVAVLDALGQRHDPSAASQVRGLTKSEDKAVQQAAWAALAKLPTTDSVAAFKEFIASKETTAFEHALNYAQTLIDADHTAEADQLLQTVWTAINHSPQPALHRCDVIRNYARIGNKRGIKLILEQLDSDNMRVQGAAVLACAMVPGEAASEAITKKLDTLEPRLQVRVLEALGHRGQWMSDRAVIQMYKAVFSPEAAVREAYIEATLESGVTLTVPTLLKMLRDDPSDAVRKAAERALNRLPGDEVTQQLIEALPEAKPEAKAKLLLALGRRGGSDVPSLLTKHADSDSQTVRLAAYEAMGLLHKESVITPLLAAFAEPDSPEAAQAERALAKLRVAATNDRLIATYPKLESPQKAPVLRVLGQRGGGKARSLLTKEIDNDDIAIRLAAVQGFREVSDPEAAEQLLKAAKAGPQSVTTAAIDGYLSAADAKVATDPAGAVNMYPQALDLATTDEQKKRALRGIAKVGDSADASLLPKLEPFMRAGNARSEAAMAVTALVVKLDTTDKQQVVDTLQEVVRLTNDRETVAKAVTRLRDLGVEIDPARNDGFITCWWLAGPFETGQGADYAEPAIEPAKIDLAQPIESNGNTFMWERFHTADPQGFVDLIGAIAKRSSVTGYAYAEVTLDTAIEAQLRMGSDDGIVAWLNGEQVHANNVNRGCKVDQDIVTVQLKPGTNRLLLQILQGGGFWQFCARLTDEEGKPLRFEQKMR